MHTSRWASRGWRREGLNTRGWQHEGLKGLEVDVWWPHSRGWKRGM